ncbi:MAG: glucosaminidase domain-containing protein [Prevotellaceae bacterium]|nr:glucosaminidase domain-containing protein [Prevotellaceae bacterium]
MYNKLHILTAKPAMTIFFFLAMLGATRAQAPANAVLDIPQRIMGSGRLTAEQLVTFIAVTAIKGDAEYAARLAPLYIAEAQLEGVNHDVAFAQMILETGFLQFKGVVSPHMNNFCGLGAVSPKQTGHVFPDERTGIRAHIQHLKAYASSEPLIGELIDPRYHFVNPRGKAPTIDELTGAWAQDPHYANKIKSLLKRMYYTANVGM